MTVAVVEFIHHHLYWMEYTIRSRYGDIPA
jgi:hypothetical protein